MREHRFDEKTQTWKPTAQDLDAQTYMDSKFSEANGNDDAGPYFYAYHLRDAFLAGMKASKPADVATQAKYFHRIEAVSDGQKVVQTVGFQTHRELIEYLFATEESEARADKLSYLLGPRAAEQSDTPTICEASK